MNDTVASIRESAERARSDRSHARLLLREVEATVDAMDTIETFILLLAFVAVIAVGARRLGIPYPILMILGGLRLASTTGRRR